MRDSFGAELHDAEFELRKKTFSEPYKLINAPLYRIYLFETLTAKYLYADFHHTLFDGISTNVILNREFDLRYRGKLPRRTPPKYADLISIAEVLRLFTPKTCLTNARRSFFKKEI